MTIDLAELLATVRRVLADPETPVPQTGDAALDQALVALAACRLQGTTLPFWMLVSAEREGQVHLQ